MLLLLLQNSVIDMESGRISLPTESFHNRLKYANIIIILPLGMREGRFVTSMCCHDQLVVATVTLLIVILSADITAASSHAGNSKKEAPPVGGTHIIIIQQCHLLSRVRLYRR